jgi:hypothetical protein
MYDATMLGRFPDLHFCIFLLTSGKRPKAAVYTIHICSKTSGRLRHSSEATLRLKLVVIKVAVRCELKSNLTQLSKYKVTWSLRRRLV